MADTNHAHATPPVEEDAVSFSGIFWFAVVLTVTTLFCQALVWGMFELMEYRANRSDAARSPLAAAPAQPRIEAGRMETGAATTQPGLLITEPTVLHDFRAKEHELLTTYGLDPMTGAVRIPLDRAKALVIERGLPARAGATVSAQPAAPAPTNAAPAQPAHSAGH